MVIYNLVRFVFAYYTGGLSVFLCTHKGQAYLVSYNPKTDSFGCMCPCCIRMEHRNAIVTAVRESVGYGSVSNRNPVLWCSGRTHPGHGWETIARAFPDSCHLFAEGSVENIPAEVKAAIRAEIEDKGLVKSGKIKVHDPNTGVRKSGQVGAVVGNG